MKGRRRFKFPIMAKSTLCIITVAGFAGLTVKTTNPNFISFIDDSPFASVAVAEKIRAGLSCVVRSSRAVFTIASTVIDYKYSLYGLPSDSEEYLAKLSQVHQRSAKRILRLCESNKGFYVKAGQFIAAMRNIPKEYSSTLSSLQDQVVPCHFKVIKEVLITNLGRDLSEIFLSVDEQPIAAASIAQVHRALLKDNQEVAIKVQYPGLERQMKIDTATMSILSKFVSWIFPDYRFKSIVSEFEGAVSLELDFVQEARNSERTAKNFKNNRIVRIPRVFWDLTTDQVLTMQYCSGCKVDDLEFLKESRIDSVKVAKALMEVFAEMIFVHGFLHGDPHPGNILVSPEGPLGFCLVILDHGIYKELDEEFRLDYCQLWKALILLDSKKIWQIGERFGVGKYAKYFPLIFTGRTIDSKSALGREMSVEDRMNMKQELKCLKMEDILSFMEFLPSEFLAILRTDGLLRSIIRKLGAPRKVRLLAYAKYAVYSLSTKSNIEPDLTFKHVGFRFKAFISYFQLRILLETLEFLSWLDDLRLLMKNKFKHMLREASHFLVRVVY